MKIGSIKNDPTCNTLFQGINVAAGQMLKKGNSLVKFSEQKYPYAPWEKAHF